MSDRSKWMQAFLSDLYEFKNGVNADRQAYGRGVPFINVLEPITFSHLKGHEISGRVDLPGAAVAAYEVRQGDLVFNRTSEIGDEVGLAATYLGTECVVFGGFVIRARPVSKLIDSTFAAYALRAPDVRTQIIAMGQGAVRANIGQDNLRRVELKFPPLPEQLAIATALADADALIDSLEQLLTKKRQIKQGAMQELLTGKRRLPGFCLPWQTYRLDEITDPFTRLNRDAAELPVITCSKHLGFVDSLAFFRNQVFSNDTSTYKVVLRGQLAYPANHIEEGSIGYQDLYEEALVSPIYVVFQPRTGTNGKFLHRLLKLPHFLPVFGKFTSSSVDRRGSLRWPAFSTIEVALPTEEEQIEVVQVIEALESEVSALEARLVKARALKQAMAQALLTGRIRLVEPIA